MRKTLAFLVAFWALFPVYCFNQILVGVKGGYNFGVALESPNRDIHNDAALSVSQNSFLLSAFYKSRLPDKSVNWGGEVEYYKTGLTGHQIAGGNGAGKISNYNFTLHFLNLILKPEFVFGSKWKFIINTGAFMGILFKVITTGDYKTYGPPPLSSGEINETNNHYFNVLNFGFLGGIGTEYPVSNRLVISLEANGIVGITKLAGGSLSSVYFNLLNFQLSAGMAYKISQLKEPGKEKKKID